MPVEDNVEKNHHNQTAINLENSVEANLEISESVEESAELVTSFHREEVTLDVQIPEEDLEWLFKSAVALLEEEKDIKLIQQELLEAGLSVTARRIDRLRILLTFAFEEAMKAKVKSPSAALLKGFISVTPWVMAEEDPLLAVWVQLEEVPLEL